VPAATFKSSLRTLAFTVSLSTNFGAIRMAASSRIETANAQATVPITIFLHLIIGFSHED